MTKPLEIIKAYQTAIWDNKDITAIDTYFDDKAMIHSPVKASIGSAALKEVIAKWQVGFPDMTVRWDDFICENNINFTLYIRSL